MHDIEERLASIEKLLENLVEQIDELRDEVDTISNALFNEGVLN